MMKNVRLLLIRSITAPLILCWMAFAAHAQPPAAHSNGLVDRVIAVVNGEVITQRTLDALTTQTVHHLQQSGAPMPDAASLRAQVLEQLVLKRIQLQKAREGAIRVSDAELTEALDRLAQESGLPREEYRAQLERQGIPWATVKRDMEDEMRLAQLREREINRQIVISDAEVEDYLAHAVASDMTQTHARHILLQVSDNASQMRARRQLLEVKRKVEAGGDFADFARQLSSDGTAAQGGDLGWLDPGQTVPEFEHAMDNLKEGEVSSPIRTPYGLHLIQVVERRQTELSEQQKHNIVRQTLGMRKAARAYANWLRALRDKASVQYMTPEFS